jgi:hypothetical protein
MSMSNRRRIQGGIAVALTWLCAVLACSDGDSPRAVDPSSSDANLTAASSADPSQDQHVDCRNPSRFFQCSGADCCAEEPTCQEGQLPFADVCGCGCLAASCQPGNRDYATTSPHECSTGTRPECQPEIESPFDDECGCGCTDLVNLPAGCDVPNRTYVCKGYGCCPGLDWSCPEGARGFENECGCGCEAVSSGDACERPDRTFVCRGPECCIGIDFPCPEGTRGFDNACGCGCEK